MSAGQSFEGPNGPEYVIENDGAITELLLDATDLASRLESSGIKPDCLIGVSREVRRSIFRKPERFTEYIEGWNMYGCEPAGIESLALSTNGVFYLNSVDLMYGGDDQVPVMPLGYELSDVHFATFARVDELRERLNKLAASHKI